MRSLYRHLFITLSLLISFGLSAHAALPTDQSLAPMLKKALPSIVNIRAQIHITDYNTLMEMQRERDQNKDDSPIPSTILSVASGVIVEAQKGYILTNAHVVTDAKTIAVTLSDGRHFTAKVIGEDKPSDVALLQINASNLTAMTLSDSNQLNVGDFVAAIGNPFGLNQTVTSGIVSALGRTTLGIENFENFIQTDAPINPGNSGGALINMKGELVGINTAILAPAHGSIGIGFAIPANMAKSVMQQLIQFGDVKRGILGVSAQDITPELATAFGVSLKQGAIVTQVLPASPAAGADIQVGDIITAVNDSVVKNASDVVNTVGFLRVNSKVDIKLNRQNKELTMHVNLTDAGLRKENIAKQDPFLYGVGFKNLKLLSPLHGNVEGVAVIGVEEDSNAWNADLRAGDVITSVNQTKITNILDMKSAVSKAKDTLLLNILRGPTAIFIVINRQG